MRRNRVAITALALLAAAIPSAYGQVGRASYDFLEIPTSAHSMALGGSGIALISDDVTLADQNPALIGPELDCQAAVGYMRWFGQSNFASLRYGMGAGERGAWAAGIRYLDYGTFQGYDEIGGATGEFKAQDIVFEGTYSHDFTDRLRGGINLNLVYSHYEQYSAFAVSADVGINYFDDEHDLSLSAVLRHMGGQLKRFDTAYTRLPFDIQLGYMQGLGHSPFSLAITARHLTKWRLPYYSHATDKEEEQQTIKSGFFDNLFRHLVFGLQYSASDKFYIALGYDYKMRGDMGSYQRNFLTGFSVGTGFKVKGFGVDVAFAQPHKGATTLLLNLSCSIGELMH